MVVPPGVIHGRGPRPLLSPLAERQLGRRHRAVLDGLEALFLREGFAGLSVRALASHVGCSRRTLYELAPSKDELVLVVLDRVLQRVGRDALERIDPARPVADQIRSYFRSAVELQRLSQVFAGDLAGAPAARRLFDRHVGHVTAVTAQLVATGIARGELRPVAPAVVAGVLAGGGVVFNQPDVLAESGLDAQRSIDEMLDLVVRSIVA